MVIVIDSREKNPYEVMRYGTETASLPIGDYSIRGFEDEVAIERKTASDLTACLSQEREKKRFEQELARSRALDFFAVVIEASFSDLAYANNGSSKTSAKARLEALLRLVVKYRVPLYFAGNREQARWLTIALLESFWMQLTEMAKAVEAASKSEVRLAQFLKQRELV